MSYPDGVIGLLSGSASLKTHATTVPFIQMELANPKVRTLFTSYDVIGRRHTLIVAYTSARWRQASPKLYQTTFDGPSDAMAMIRRDPCATAELFLRQEPSKLDQEAATSTCCISRPYRPASWRSRTI